MKFIHVSDVNLFAAGFENRFGDPGSEEHVRDFRKVLDACRTEQADLLFLTGNLFALCPDEKMLSYVDDAFATLSKTRVFYVLGPNEAKAASSIAAYPFRSPVKVFTGSSIERVYLPKLSVEVQGVGYSEKTWNRSEIKELVPGKKGNVQILLLPKDLPDVSEWPFHYVGTGGTEKLEGVPGKRVYAPGSLEPTRYLPFTRHGYYVGEFGAMGKNVIGPAVRFLEGASREWVLLNLNVTPEQSLEDVRAEIEKQILTYGTAHSYRVKITGTASIGVAEGAEVLSGIPGVTAVDVETDLSKTFEALKELHGDDAIGRFLRDMLDRDPSPGRDQAIRYGLKALEKAQAEAEEEK